MKKYTLSLKTLAAVYFGQSFGHVLPSLLYVVHCSIGQRSKQGE
ncbi:MAG: hypothetical protein Q9M28_05305 [Mariprofundaceae bacterium]|nr:hypothetical protein [Mariprofundaceae bacterium]